LRSLVQYVEERRGADRLGAGFRQVFGAITGTKNVGQGLFNPSGFDAGSEGVAEHHRGDRAEGLAASFANHKIVKMSLGPG
jgi:hypothetical protein